MRSRRILALAAVLALPLTATAATAAPATSGTGSVVSKAEGGQPIINVRRGGGHGGHGHGHHEHWFKRYFWSTDHKVIGMQYLLPQRLLSGIVGWIAESRIGFLRAGLIAIRKHGEKVQTVNAEDFADALADSRATADGGLNGV